VTSLGSLARVLGAPVRVEDTLIGHVSGVVGNPGFERVIGLDVVGSDGSRTFLPWIAATVLGRRVFASSRLVLFPGDQVEEYERRGAVTLQSARELALLAVDRNGSVRALAADVSTQPATGTSTM
jgi:hypothetical protein